LGVPVVVDVGSGLLDATCPWLRGGPPEWLRDEPACRQTLAAGAALITFSGDKLLGGPQAGVVAGSAAMVARCRRQPLARAVRPGGHVLGAVQQLALAYLRNDGDAIPLWRMASVPVEVLRQRAQAIVASVGDPAIVVDTDATMGGGSAPGTVVPSAGVAVPGSVATELRNAPTPVLARVVDDHTVADLRTVDPSHDDLLAAALKAAVLQ